MNTQTTTHGHALTADILKAATALGVLGGAAQTGRRLLAMLCNPTITAGEIAAAIDREPGMAARVLRVANSAFYGLTRKVSTIDRALMLLGLNAVRGIAAAACLDRTVLQGKDAPQFEVAALLRHSVAVAAAASELARLRKPALVSEAFIAGLLHDYGVLAQIRVDPPGVQAFTRLLQSPDAIPAGWLESQSVKVTHEECAAVIFADWKLPDNLVASAQYHHNPDAVPEVHAEIAAVVHIADHLGRTAEMGFSYEPLPEPVSRRAMEIVGVTDTDLELIGAGLPERVQALQQSLNAA